MSDSTVFIVDDDAAAAASVAALAQSLGLQAESFSSAEEFLDRYDGRPGCLVLDVRLKGMSGLELQQQLDGRGIDLAAIIISGHADRDLYDEALANGAVACLEKPYDGRKFCEALLAALNR